MKLTEYGFCVNDHYLLPPFITDGFSGRNSWEKSRGCSGSEWSTDEAVVGAWELSLAEKRPAFKMLANPRNRYGDECKWRAWIHESSATRYTRPDKYLAYFHHLETGDRYVIHTSTLRLAMLWITANLVKEGYWAHSPLYRGKSADKWIVDIETREYMKMTFGNGRHA